MFDHMTEIQRKRWRAGIAIALWFAQAAYIVFPFDLIPDFIPFVGWLDDLVGLAGMGATTLWMLKHVHEAGLMNLLGLAETRPVVEAGDYEPLSADAIRSM